MPSANKSFQQAFLYNGAILIPKQESTVNSFSRDLEMNSDKDVLYRPLARSDGVDQQLAAEDRPGATTARLSLTHRLHIAFLYAILGCSFLFFFIYYRSTAEGKCLDPLLQGIWCE